MKDSESKDQRIVTGTTSIPNPVTTIVVDLDGTLCASDTLFESLWWLARHKPLRLLKLFPKILEGKAQFKSEVFKAIEPESIIKFLPWNKSVIKYLKEERNRNKQIILATASDINFATLIQKEFPFISKVFATNTNKDINLKGHEKANLLVSEFGVGGFDYLANDQSDIPAWKKSNNVILVSDFSNPLLRQKIEKIKPIKTYFPLPTRRLDILAKALRIKQWAKNLLVFAPMIASHAYFDPEKWLSGLWTFLAFSLCASGAYLLNDLLDIENDRSHHQKHSRPLAQGIFPLQLAFGLSILLPLSGLLIALNLGIGIYILIYLVTTVLYSLWLKKIAIVDIASLAGLYCLRIITGGEATQDPVSFWMAAFGGFLFVSLACIKRQAELLNLESNPCDSPKEIKTMGREYNLNDIALTRNIGVATGCIAPLVLALYLEANAGEQFYAHPEYLWGSCGLIFVWVMSLWRDTEQKKLGDEDPISYSLTNKKSLTLLGLLAITLILATYIP